jgi:hypothetical protein
MQASSQRTGQVRLALMLIVGVVAAAACVVTLMWWKAPVASAQDEGGDPTGANFVVSCGFSKQAQVDPIVNPGEPGTPEAKAHHMHDFFGNTTTDSNSTLDTLRAGGTTCSKPKDTAAYWHPTVSWTSNRGKITPLKASQTFFYYRAGLKAPATVKPFPPGLKIVTVQGKKVEWRCQNGTWSPTPPTRCDNGTLVVRIFFPDCLDVDDSVPPPRLQTNFLFRIPTTKGKPTLSSGEYSTMHVDFFNAWQPPQQPPPTPPAVDGTLEDLVARCINKAPFTSSNPKPKDCA